MGNVIGFCRQDGNAVKVYDETGRHLWTQDGTLAGFTSSTVIIERRDANYVYDPAGHHVYTFYR